MLTREENQSLDAIREHLDDEDKAAFDALSDEEKKEFLKETRKAIHSPKSRLQAIREMPLGDFVSGYAEYGPLAAALVWVIVRMTGSKKGCGFLLVFIAIIAIVIAVFVAPNL